MAKQVNLALLGAGNRGQGIFGQYALDMPHRCRFSAVVEPDAAKREFFAKNHNIAAERCFSSFDEFFTAGLDDLDGVVIATLEDQRIRPILDSMQKGYHILVEKPLCTNVDELIKLYDATVNYEKILIVCHQMRLAPAYRTIKEYIAHAVWVKLWRSSTAKISVTRTWRIHLSAAFSITQNLLRCCWQNPVTTWTSFHTGPV